MTLRDAPRTGRTQATPHDDDSAVHRKPSRGDWIEIYRAPRADLGRLSDLLAIAMAANI